MCRFGGKLDDYPHPELDFTHFMEVVNKKNAATGVVWDPLEKKNKHWMDARAVTAVYGKQGCTIS